MDGLRGQRVLVVGGSSGIGRAVGMLGAAAGAHVAFAGRRAVELEAAVAEVGPPSVAITCDVRDPDQCARTVAEAVAELGALDAVVYAAGASPLTPVVEADAELWRALLETNVVGAALVAAASLPHLSASRGRLVLLGSSSVGRPYPGLVPYATSKAALHELARGLRAEHPSVRVTTFVVGPTATSFADGWDPELTMAMFTRWQAEGYPAAEAVMSPEAMAAQILHVLTSGGRIDEVHVMPDKEPAAESSASPAG